MTAGTLEERVPLSNGASHREAVQQQMYHAGLPHAPMYTAMLPGMPQRLHPIVSSLQMGNGYSDFFKLPYPFLVQNGSLYNPRIPAGTALLERAIPALHVVTPPIGHTWAYHKSRMHNFPLGMWIERPPSHQMFSRPSKLHLFGMPS